MKGTVHVENILKTQIGAGEDEIDVEESVNPDDFLVIIGDPSKLCIG